MNRHLLPIFLLLVLLSLFVGACGPTEPPPATARPPQPTLALPPTTTPAPTPAAPPPPTPAAPPPTTPARVPPPSRYEHPAGLFGLDYPTDWLIEESELAVQFVNADDTMGVFVHYSDLDRVLDAAEVDQFIEDFFAPETGIAANPGFERGDPTPQGDGSILVEYSFDSDGDTAYGASFFEQHDTIMYILSFLAMDSASWDAILPTFNTIANSFEVYGAPEKPAGEWSTLTSEVGGYAIDYPGDWEAFEYEGDAYIERDEETFLVILVTTTLPAADPDEAERLMTEEIIESLLTDDPNADIDAPDTIAMGDEMGVYIDFVYVDPDTGLQNSGTAVHVVRGGMGYRLLIFTLTEDFAETSDYFVQMLLSFRFLR